MRAKHRTALAATRSSEVSVEDEIAHLRDLDLKGHLARNENTSASVKALVGHSRAAKDKPLIVAVKK
jgi:hypothetical protein